MFCWSPQVSRVHGAVQVLQPVLPLPPALLQEEQTDSQLAATVTVTDQLMAAPSYLVLLELLVLRVVGGQLQAAQRAGVGLQVDTQRGGLSQWGQMSAGGGALQGCSHVAEPGQDAGGVEEMFAGHLVELLLLLEFQQTHWTLDTFF